MTNKISIAAYSDIHYHQYANGITLDDVSRVDSLILDEIKKRNCKICIFGGDRFQSRNPDDIVRLAADSAFKEKSAEYHENGRTGIVVVGNHDRVLHDPNSHHTLSYVGLYPNDLKNMYIADKVTIHVVPYGNKNIAIHCVPAGHLHNYTPPHKNYDFNILVFHDMIKGCRLQNNATMSKGIPSSLIDHNIFNLVLGGDNHRHQQLNLKNTTGYYIGAPMQHNWGDEGDKGFLVIDLDLDTKKYTVEFIPVQSPKFLKFDLIIEHEKDIVEWVEQNKNHLTGNIIKLLIHGKSNVIAGIPLSKWKNKLTSMSNARQIDIKPKYINEYVNTSKYSKMSDIDSWKEFVALMSGGLEDYDTNKIEQLGTHIISSIC